jgi:hypothetical protein
MFISKFEDLANEILLDIFDHLRPIDIIHGFSMLNYRLQILLIQRRIHIDLSTNISFNEFNEYCSKIFLDYSSCIYSIRLSNIETCGEIKLFFEKFSQINITFPNLYRMSFIEPNESEYKQIITLKHLTSIHVKYSKINEKEIYPGLLFDIPNLDT